MLHKPRSGVEQDPTHTSILDTFIITNLDRIEWFQTRSTYNSSVDLPSELNCVEWCQRESFHLLGQQRIRQFSIHLSAQNYDHCLILAALNFQLH